MEMDKTSRSIINRFCDLIKGQLNFRDFTFVRFMKSNLVERHYI